MDPSGDRVREKDKIKKRIPGFLKWNAPPSTAASSTSSEKEKSQHQTEPQPASLNVPDLQPPSLQMAVLPSGKPMSTAINDVGKDLWARALDKLDNKDKKLIGELTLRPTGTSLMDDIVNLTIKKRDECEKKRWKFSLNGKDVILRDVAEKVIKWLKVFRDVGDVAVNFDPIHFALPWAGIRFILEVTKHNISFVIAQVNKRLHRWLSLNVNKWAPSSLA
jgi:hypothetical protein